MESFGPWFASTALVYIGAAGHTCIAVNGTTRLSPSILLVCVFD